MLAKGSFVDFSVTVWMGWAGTGWYVARYSRDTWGRVRGGEGGGESFGSACTCYNRLVRDMLVEKTKAFFPRYFAPLRWSISDSLIRISQRSRARIFFSFLAFTAMFLSVRLSAPVAHSVIVAQRCPSLHAAFLLSLAWRDLTRRMRFKRFIRSREIRIESAQPGFINKRIDRLAEKRMVCGWSR